MERKAVRAVLVLALVAGAAACGKKGPLSLPQSSIPAAVEVISARQRGRTIVLEWTLPAKNVDGRPCGPLNSVEIWVLEYAPGRPHDQKKPGPGLTGEAALVASIPRAEFASAMKAPVREPGIMTHVFAPAVFEAGRVYDFYLRALNGRKRPGEFSDPVSVVLAACPDPPTELAVEVRADAVRLSWRPPEAGGRGSTQAAVGGYNIYRREGDGPWKAAGRAEAGARSFEDRNFAFGRHYTYVVRAEAGGGNGAVESADSPPAEVEARDVFPPSRPAGLAAVAGPGGISLSWEAPPEADTVGYIVRRGEPGGAEFAVLTAEAVRGTSFLDMTAVAGRTYVYRVSAVDGAGNEGPFTESVPVAAAGVK